jgi:putative phosphoribosyl transferase
MRFADRKQAGMELGHELAKLGLHSPVVLALPRGGVPVGAEVAAILHAPLEVLIVRKVGAPDNPELAAAALVAGNPDDIVLNHDIVEAYGLTNSDLRVLVNRERPELERRVALYTRDRRHLLIANKTAIIVDDGVATGTTAKVAIRALRRRGPRKIVLALPVGPKSIVEDLRAEADTVVCIRPEEHFRALSLHYVNFKQVSDEEVIDALNTAEASYKAAHSPRNVRAHTDLE